MTKFYWYLAYNSEPDCDMIIVLGKRDYDIFGFKEEPAYEIVETHDLRNEFFGTIEELQGKYKL